MLEIIWERCVEVSVIIIALLVFRPLLKRLPRIGMYILWIAVLVRIVCPISVTVPTEIREMLEKKVVQVKEIVTPSASHIESENLYVADEGNVLQTVSKETDNQKKTTGQEEISSDAEQEKNRDENQEAPSSTDINWDWVLLGIWGMGVLLCTVYLILSLWQSNRYCKMATHLYDNVYEHDKIQSSFVCGIVKPRIYLPVHLQEEAKECILLHERIHIKRQDYRIKPLAFFIFSLMWFNPLVWIAWRCMMMDMEMSCDEAVLRKLGSDVRKKYSYLLLQMAVGERDELFVTPAFAEGVLKERIKCVMGYKKPRKVLWVFMAVVVVLCSCGVAVTPKQEEAVTPKESSVSSKEGRDYVEQAIAEEKNYSDSSHLGMTIDNSGELVELIGVREQWEVGEIPVISEYQMTKFAEDGSREVVETKWLKSVNQRLEGSDCDIDGYYYGDDGYIYLNINRYSAKLEQYCKELYEGDMERAKESFYQIDDYLLQVNPDTGELKEISMPVEKAEKAYAGTELHDASGSKGIANNFYKLLGNGNVLVTNYANLFEIRNLQTGELVKEVSYLVTEKQRAYGFYVGSGGIVVVAKNPETQKMELNIYDELGENGYAVEADIQYDDEMGPNYAICLEDETIVLATGKGIFEMEFGDDAFQKIVDSSQESIYYLSPTEFYPLEVHKDGKGCYYMTLSKKESSDGKFCKYSPKGR